LPSVLDPAGPFRNWEELKGEAQSLLVLVGAGGTDAGCAHS
jgi:hypothetical protein